MFYGSFQIDCLDFMIFGFTTHARKRQDHTASHHPYRHIFLAQGRACEVKRPG